MAILLKFWMTCLMAVSSYTGEVSDIPKSNLRSEIRELIAYPRDRVFPTVVSIQVITLNYQDGKQVKSRSGGSGIIITDQGHVLTNYHVTQNGILFKVSLSNMQELRADMIGEDPLTDLSVLKILPEDIEKLGEPLSIAEFGRSDQLNIGDYVLAMGSPYTLSRSVTLGIVSNTNRVLHGKLGISGEGLELDSGWRSGLFTRWIQHDAAINPGNSGGPLVNLLGEVVGINELGGTEIGFAIPSNLAKEVSLELIEKGSVTRSWLGATMRSLEGTGINEGVLVESVAHDGPANRAGLLAGDILLRWDQKPISAFYPEQIPPLMKTISSYSPGAEVEVVFERNQKQLNTEVTLETLEPDFGERALLREWGVVVEVLTRYRAESLQIQRQRGIIVHSTRSGWPADKAQPGIRTFDLLVAINGMAIHDLKTIKASYQDWLDQGRPPRTVKLLRQQKTIFSRLRARNDTAGNSFHELPKPWLGFDVQPFESLPENVGDGYLVSHIYRQSKAFQSSLQLGDRLLSVNSVSLAPYRNLNRLSQIIQNLPIGSDIELGILRENKPIAVVLRLDRVPLSPHEVLHYHDSQLEVEIREITFTDRQARQWQQDVMGVFVNKLERNGWTSLAGLRQGDLVLELSGVPTQNVSDWKNAVEIIQEKKKPFSQLKVLRGSRVRVLYLELSWEHISR